MCVGGGGGVPGAGMGRVLGLFGSGFSDRRESNMTREQEAQKTHQWIPHMVGGLQGLRGFSCVGGGPCTLSFTL